MADHQWGSPAPLPSDENVLNAPLGWARPLAEVVKAFFRLSLLPPRSIFQNSPNTQVKNLVYTERRTIPLRGMQCCRISASEMFDCSGFRNDSSKPMVGNRCMNGGPVRTNFMQRAMIDILFGNSPSGRVVLSSAHPRYRHFNWLIDRTRMHLWSLLISGKGIGFNLHHHHHHYHLMLRKR